MATKSDKSMQAKVYSQEGKEVTTVALPETVFGVAWNANLVHDVVVSMQGNARAGTAHTQTRGEVSGGGKKPWKQKGTGRARHGSTRSPIWVGGGVAHGPRNEKDFTRKINKNMRAKAFASVLSQKLRDDEVLFIDTFHFTEPKAKEARAVLTALSTIENKDALNTKRKNTALIVLSGRELNTELSFRNFGNIVVTTVKDVNPVELLTHKYVIVAKPEEAIKTLELRVGSKTVRKVMAIKK